MRFCMTNSKLCEGIRMQWSIIGKAMDVFWEAAGIN
jgi:hypothetical protein